MMRAERPLQLSWHCFCAGHKIHAAAQKLFLLQVPELRGICRTLLLFQQHGVLSRFRALLQQHVEANAVLIHSEVPLSQEASAFKAMIKKYFYPSDQRSRKHILVERVLSGLLNDDWRLEPELRHRCPGEHCCKDLPAFKAKLSHWLQKVLKALRPRILNRGNWLAHHECYPFLGVFCAVHKLLPNLFDKLLQGSDIDSLQDPPPQQENALDIGMLGMQDNDDVVAEQRRQQSINQKIAQDFLHGSPLDSLRVLRIALHPQVELQAKYLKRCGPESYLEGLLKTFIAQDAEMQRPFRVLCLVCGDLLEEFMRTSFEQLHSRTLWRDLAHTHQQCSVIFRVCVRPAAVIFALVHYMWSSYPARLFRLLHRASFAEEAAAFVRQPECVLDDWSIQFRRLYPNLAALMSRECQEVLAAVATELQTTAWSTERLHSRHARRSRSRRHTHTRCISTQLLACMQQIAGQNGGGSSTRSSRMLQTSRVLKLRTGHARSYGRFSLLCLTPQKNTTCLSREPNNLYVLHVSFEMSEGSVFEAIFSDLCV